MMNMNLFLKLGMGNWLYALAYELEWTSTLPAEETLRQAFLFDESRKGRFRFENRALYTLDALHDESFQYGNYHMARVSLAEDFYKGPVASLLDHLQETVAAAAPPALRQQLFQKSNTLLSTTVRELTAGYGEGFALDVDAPSLK
jgi:hypothetical protein